MSIVKGNIVVSKRNERTGIVLAVTKDGKRARVYVYGPDTDVWVPITGFTVEVSGDEVCYKCAGSGLFFMGGAVVNGRYTGKTGECYGCSGKGYQTDADRVRCHYYWHRQREIEQGVEDAEQGKPVKPLSTPLTRPLERNPQPSLTDPPMPEASTPVKTPAKKVKIRSKSSAKGTPSPVPGSTLIDCNGCNTLHRDDTMCPW